MVSGAAALLLEDEPNLTPNRFKYRLKAAANNQCPGSNTAQAGAGYLDVNTAVNGTTMASASTETAISKLLFTGTTSTNNGSASWSSDYWKP